VDFEATDQLMIIYSAYVKYLRKMRTQPGRRTKSQYKDWSKEFKYLGTTLS